MEAGAAAYLREAFPEEADLALWVAEVVLAADPDLVERVYRGWRGVGFRHPEAGYVCAVFPKGGSVDLLFEHGAALADPAGVLRNGGRQTRTIRVQRQGQDMAEVIRLYVQQAITERLLRS